MNEYRGLWRGKSRDIWVVGYVMYYAGGFQIWQKDEKYGSTDNYVVDEETLGKCTCVPDKHDKLIFEGDIVKDSIGHTFIVKWIDERAMFVLSQLTHGTLISHFTPVVSYEIIGNIHDNPELLKGAAE